MSRPDNMGVSLRQHYDQYRKQRKKRHPDDVDVPVPEQAQYLWKLFWHLRAGFTRDKELTYQEIKAYCDLTGTSLIAWEAETLKKMDVARITA